MSENVMFARAQTELGSFYAAGVKKSVFPTSSVTMSTTGEVTIVISTKYRL